MYVQRCTTTAKQWHALWSDLKMYAQMYACMFVYMYVSLSVSINKVDSYTSTISHTDHTYACKYIFTHTYIQHTHAWRPIVTLAQRSQCIPINMFTQPLHNLFSCMF